LVSFMHHISQAMGMPRFDSGLLFLIIALIVVVSLCLVVGENRNGTLSHERIDLEFALFVSAIPLISPISWFHYFVLLILPIVELCKISLTRNNVRNYAALFLLLMVLSIPPVVGQDAVAVLQKVSWRLSLLLSTIPSIAIVGMMLVLARFLVPRFSFADFHFH